LWTLLQTWKKLELADRIQTVLHARELNLL
jgi:hypothetical protein